LKLKLQIKIKLKICNLKSWVEKVFVKMFIQGLAASLLFVVKIFKNFLFFSKYKFATSFLDRSCWKWETDKWQSQKSKNKKKLFWVVIYQFINWIFQTLRSLKFWLELKNLILNLSQDSCSRIMQRHNALNKIIL